MTNQHTPSKGRPLTRTQPNPRLIQAGERLSGHIAHNASLALASIRDRLNRLDGYSSSSDGATAGNTESSTTERIAAQRYHLKNALEDMRTGLDDVLKTVDLFARLVEDTLRHTDPDAIPAAARKACNDGQAFLTQAHGDRAGVVTWGDPLCIREATKAGLCGSHYMAWYRHRQANGIDTRKDFAA